MEIPPTLSPVLEAMSQPGFYPNAPTAVEIRHTHTSCVFLVGDTAYKVRKPVKLPFIDCSTPARRHDLCQLEVEINRRLSPDVYLGVIPIVLTAGRYRFDAAPDGDPSSVDYAVAMRRLPDERRLDQLIESGLVTTADIEAISQRMAAFHRTASRDQAWNYGSAARVWQQMVGNLNETRELAADTLTNDRLTTIANFTRQFISTHWEFINQRARDGRVCDGHGDLRCDSIYLMPDDIRIVDALEFSERLRYCDVAADIAFLAMDLDYIGRSDLSRELVRSYCAATNDPDLTILLPLYKSSRATVRAKVELTRSRQDDCSVADRVLARERARRYLELACEYAKTPRTLTLVVVCGLSGTGKSTLARAIRDRIGFQVLSSDAERKRLAGVQPTVRLNASYGSGAYTEDFTQRVYESLLAKAEEVLRLGSGVILDATFRRRSERAMAAELARRLGINLIFVECRAEKSVVIRRLIERSSRLDEISDATVDIYLAQLREFEPLDEVSPSSLLVVGSDQAHNAETILAAIEHRISADSQ